MNDEFTFDEVRLLRRLARTRAIALYGVSDENWRKLGDRAGRMVGMEKPFNEHVNDQLATEPVADRTVEFSIHVYGKARSGVRVDMVSTIDGQTATDGKDEPNLLEAYLGLQAFFENATLIMTGVLTVDENDRLVPRTPTESPRV